MTAIIAATAGVSYADGMRGWYLVSVWLHLLAAMTWVGGMIALVVAVVPYLVRCSAESVAPNRGRCD